MSRMSVVPLFAVIAISACSGGGGGGFNGGNAGGGGAAPPPIVPQPPPSTVSFADVTQASNLEFGVGFTTPPLSGFPELLVSESTFGGVAAGDCDGDTDIDLFVTYGDSDIFGSGPGGPNRLYRNLLDQGNPLVFEDIALAAGVAYTRRDPVTGDAVGNDRHSGPAFVDLDGDGDLDLFIGGLFGDASHIFENRGDCTFDDVTQNSPQFVAMRAANSFSAAFGDYDLDGDLDMLLTHWGTRDAVYGVPRSLETDHLWENVSDGSGIRFENASEASGLSALLWTTRAYGASGTQEVDFTFTPAFARIDGDLWPDIAIAADFDTSQILFNNGGATFRSSGSSALRTPLNGMGSALGDIDFDGDLDWFVTGIHNPDAIGAVTPRGNRLFRNDGGTSFRDVTDAKGVAAGEWGWGACFLDIDNDADLDIFHVNGWNLPDDRAHNHDFSIDRSRAFVAGSNGVFIEQAASLGVDDAYNARAVVCADFDEDGDIDLLVTTDKAPNSALLWRNDAASAGRNYLRVRLAGSAPNTAAIGARIFVQVGGREYMREVMAGGNYTAQNPTVQVFGLGSATQVDRIRVEWPAVVPGPGLAPVQQQTLIDNAADARLRATAPGQTLMLAQPVP